MGLQKKERGRLAPRWTRKNNNGKGKEMRKRLLTLTVLLAGLVLATDGFAGERMMIVGTGDGVAVLDAIGKVFGEKTGVEVVVPPSIGSGGGVKAVGADKTPMGRVARGIKESEKKYGLTYTPIFKIPTVFFVHKSVSVTDLSAGQVVGIYQRKITNWKEVGGADKPVNVVRREDGDSSLKNLQKTFPGFKDLVLSDKIRTAEKTPVMVKIISSLEDSIGFGPLDVAVANGLKVLKIDGKSPTDSGYPTLGTIALIYKESNFSGDLKKFVDFATSKAAHDAVRGAGGIPIVK